MGTKNLFNIYCNIIVIFFFLFTIIGCSPDNEGGLPDSYQEVDVSPEVIVSGLNFPWGIDYINNKDEVGTGPGSVLQDGNILVANRGTVGHWANTILQINPYTKDILEYCDYTKKDLHADCAVEGPMDVAFKGPFVWIANDAGGLGSIAVTDPNPSIPPNGRNGVYGEPVDGPTGTGVFGDDDFGFIVLSIFPEDGAEAVSQDTKIEVTFSHPVDPDSITIDSFQVTVDYSPLSPDPDDPDGTFIFSDDYTRVLFQIDSYLAEDTRYKIKLDKDIKDYKGFHLDGNTRSPGPDDFISYFTTGAGNPRVTWVHPRNGEAYVPTDTVVDVGFSEPIKESSITKSSFFLLDEEGDKVDGDVFVNENLIQARFVPEVLLEKNADYFVNVTSQVEDLAGNSLDQIPGGYPDDFQSSFSTGAGSAGPPTVVSIIPENGAQGVDVSSNITVTFSKSIDQGSCADDYFILRSENNNVLGTTQWSSDTEFIFTPESDLEEGMNYIVEISDCLSDLYGNQLDGDYDGIPGGRFQSSFSTGWDRLYVTSSVPEDGGYNISIGTYIYVNFSKPINATSLTTQSFYLLNEAYPDEKIESSVWVNPGNTSATLKPDAYLDENTTYSFFVTNDVSDVSGNPLDQTPGLPLDPFKATFTTGGQDNVPPCVVQISPADGAVDVPVGIVITVCFSEPVLPATVNSESFIVSGEGGVVTGNFAFSDGNATVMFQPDDDLIPNKIYSVTLKSTISDASGNGLDGDCDGNPGPDYSSTFETGEGKVVINEVVVDPQQDWNDSEGGDSIPFNSVPGNGAITTSDEWIEIFNGSNTTFDLSNWTLEMIDSTPETHVIGSGSGTEVIYPPTSTISHFTPGSYLIIGNPVGSNNNDCYFVLKNNLGNIVDDVEIGDDPEGDGPGDGAPEAGEDGNADSINDEAIARVPNGVDSDNDQVDFRKQQATIGSDNNGKSGFGPNIGHFIGSSELIGISGIVSAGPAPDLSSDMNFLYFATHVKRSVVYGVDFDNGVYYAFTGVDAPTDLEYIPDKGAYEGINPGFGTLFILDPGKGNMVRVQMMASGPIGDPNTLSVPQEYGEDAVMYLTYPDFSDPTGIVYSSKYNVLYVACRGNGKILEISPEGNLIQMFNTGLGSNSIAGITLGEFNGEEVVFLSNTGGERVDKGDGPQGSIMYFNPHF